MNTPALQTIRGYELRELVGAGGFGAVYCAYQPAVDRQVAIVGRRFWSASADPLRPRECGE